MGKSKIEVHFESDTLSCMEILDSVMGELSMRKGDWKTPMPLRYDPLIEITDYNSLDWRGRGVGDWMKLERIKEGA